MKIDENFKLEGVPYNWILKYEKPTGEINEDTGKESVTKDQWYFPKIKQALEKYVEEALKPVKTVNEVLLKLEELQGIINKIKVK